MRPVYGVLRCRSLGFLFSARAKTPYFFSGIGIFSSAVMAGDTN
jgi:hypothetical protein